jgi:mono/diheme cytochrome c family protein
VVTLAVLAGPGKLYPPANLVDRSFPVEEWWWWWYSGLAALLPPKIAPAFHVLFPVALLLLLVALPFLDRGPARGIRNRPIATSVVVVCILGILVLSDLRRRSPWTGWPQAEPPRVPEGMQITERVERGRILFAEFGCYSCHPIAGRGPEVGTDFAQNKGLWSRAEIRNFILNPPREVAMPSYAGRLTRQELEALVEFCHAAQTFPRAQGSKEDESP